MNNMQQRTPDFVLTSLSFSTSEKKKIAQQHRQQNNYQGQRTIAKFDYCLPPDEFNYTEGTDHLPSA